MIHEWNSQLAKASWCQNECWHYSLYMTYTAIAVLAQLLRSES